MSRGVDRLLSGAVGNALQSDLPTKISQFSTPWPNRGNNLLTLTALWCRTYAVSHDAQQLHIRNKAPGCGRQ